MKKIYIIMVLMCLCLLTACASNYERNYQSIDDIEIVEEFGVVEKQDYLGECIEKLSEIECITYNGIYNLSEEYMKVIGSKTYISLKSKRKMNYQANEEIGIVFKETRIENRVDGKETLKWAYYFKDNEQYIKTTNGKKEYYKFSKMSDSLFYFSIDTFSNSLNNLDIKLIGYNAGKDENGNVVFLREANSSIGDIVKEVYVFKEYQLVYFQLLVFKDGEVIAELKEDYSYKRFLPIKKALRDYEYVGGV